MTIEELYDLFDDNYTVLNTHGHYTDTDECKAVEMVLDVIKELQAHREAWMKMQNEIDKRILEPWENHIGDTYFDGLCTAREMAKNLKPKEGDAV